MSQLRKLCYNSLSIRIHRNSIKRSLKIWCDSIPLHRLKFGPMSGDNWRSVLDPVGGIIFKLSIGDVETSEEKDFAEV